MSKSKFKRVADACRKVYEASGMSAVYDLVNAEQEAGSLDYEYVSYKPCRGCDNDVPSLNGICLVCGQKTGTLKYNIWVEIERVEMYEDDETYHQEDNPIKLAVRDTIEEAVEFQEEVSSSFNETRFPPVPAFMESFIEKVKREKKEAMDELNEE